jgi:hypothetical protein
VRRSCVLFSFLPGESSGATVVYDEVSSLVSFVFLFCTCPARELEGGKVAELSYCSGSEPLFGGSVWSGVILGGGLFLAWGFGGVRGW